MIVNAHERALAVSADRVGALLETLAGPADDIWHTDMAKPMILDAGLSVGSRGGHGPVRYTVVDHIPGRRIRFEFDPGIGLVGHHQIEIVDVAEDASILRHTIRAHARGAGRVVWPLLVRHIHDGVVEDILDHVERTTTGSAHRGQRTPTWLRVLARRLASQSGAARSGATQPRQPTRRGRHVTRERFRPGPLLTAAMPRPDAADGWSARRTPDESTDATDWARAVLGRTHHGIGALMRLRDALVRPLGLRTFPQDRPDTGFPLLASSPTEVLLGIDDRHLSFRVAVGIRGDRVVVLTAVRIHHPAGRLYWSVVRWFHPVVVRTLLRTTPRVTPSSAHRPHPSTGNPATAGQD